MSKQTPNQKDLESIKTIHDQLETLQNNFQNTTNSTRLTLQQHQKQLQTLSQVVDNLNSKKAQQPNNNFISTSNDQQISIFELNEKVNQLLQNQNKIISLENSIKTLTTEISIIKKQKNTYSKDSQPSELKSQDEIEQIKNELNELKEQMAIRPTLRLVERSIQNEFERQQNISSFEKQNQNDTDISLIKHDIQLLKQQIQNDKSISQISDLKNSAKELKEKLQSKDKKSTHPDEFCQQMRNELTFLEENFIEAYNFNTISLASQAKQIKQLRDIIMSPYDFDESEEDSNENSEDGVNDKRRIPDSNTKKLKNIIQNLQDSVKKQTEADHAVLRCLKYEIKKLKSQEALSSIEKSIENLRDQISNVEAKENDKIEALQDKIENAQSKLRKLRLFNGKDDNADGDIDNSTFFDGSIDSLKAHLNKLDGEVKEFRQQLQKSKTDSEDIEKSITNIVNCLRHEMKKVKNNQSALTNHLKEKGLVTSDLELECLSDDSGADVKSRSVSLPFEEVTSEKVPDGYYKIQLPDEPFDEIKKELYTLECNFIQTANVHATSIEDHYRQLEEIRKNLQEKNKRDQESSEASENKSEIIKSLKLEVQKLKQNDALTDQRMRGIEDMNNRIAAIEDYLQEEPEIVEIHPLDENGNSIQESDSSQETLIRPIIDTINAMAEEIRMIKDNYDFRDTIRCIKHELKKQSVDARKYQQPLMEKNQYQIKEINLRLDTIEDYLVNETEEEEVKENSQLNTLNDVISSIASSMSSLKNDMMKMKNAISVQNQELIPIKERIEEIDRERKKSSIASKKDIEKLKQALDSIEPKTPQETLDAIENIMKKIDETMNKQDADRSTIRCLKHEMIKLKGPLEKTGQHEEEIERINNRLNTIEEYLAEDEPIVDIENAEEEEEEEEYEEDPTLQIGKVVASLIESMKSMKDEVEELREDTYMKDNEAIRCVKHELKKLKCQIELQELMNLGESSDDAIIPKDYEEQIKRLKNELHTLENNFVDTTKHATSSIDINSMEIDKLKKRYSEFQELLKSLENEKGLTLKERLENLEHSNRCLKYEMKKLMYENEMQNILQEEMMSSSMNLSENGGDSLNMTPETERKITKIKEELRNLEKNFEETSNIHTNSLDIHELQLMKLKQLINETIGKIGGKSLHEIESKLNKQISNLENLFSERLKRTNLNVHSIEKQIENVYQNHGLIPFETKGFESVFDDDDKEMDFSAGYFKISPSKVGGNQFLFIDKNLDVLFRAVNDLRKAQIEGLNEEGITLIPDSHKGSIVEIVNSVINLDKKNRKLEKTLSDLTEEFAKLAANQDTRVLNLGEYYDDENSLNEEDSKKSSNIDGQQLNQLQNEIAELREIIQSRDSADNSAQIGNLLTLQNFSTDEDEGGFNAIADEIKNDVSNIKNDVDNQIEELKSKIASLSQQLVESTEPVVEREVRLEINKEDWSSNSLNESSEDFEIIKRDNQEMRESIDTLNQQIQGIKDAIAQHQKRIQQNEESVTLRLDVLNQSEINDNNNDDQIMIENYQNEILDLKDEISNLKNTLSCIKHELKKLKNEFKHSRDIEFSEVIRLDDPKSEFINDFDDLKDDLQNKFKRQENELDSLKSEIQQLKESYSKKYLEDQSGMMFTLSQNVANFDISNLDDKIEDYKLKSEEDNQALSNKIDELMKNIDEINKNVKNLDNKYSEDKTSYVLQNGDAIDNEEVKEIVLDSTKDINHSIKCLKYEVKRLKNELDQMKSNQNDNNNVKERGVYNLADEYSNDEDNNNNKDDLEKEIEELVTLVNEKLENDLKDMKDEIDNLREQLNQMKEDEDKRIKDANTFKFNESKSKIIEEEEEDIEKENSNHHNDNDIHSLRCIKFEIKRLKEKVKDLQDLQNSQMAERSGFNLNEVSSFINNNTDDELKNELMKAVSDSSNKIDEIKNSIGCLKHEVKRLKSKVNDIHKEQPAIERSVFAIDDESNNYISTDDLNEIKQMINDSNNEIKQDIKCMKYEIKKVKESIESINSNQDENRPEKIVFIQDNNDDNQGLTQTEKDDTLECLKYEVKRLKEKVNKINEHLNQQEQNTNNNNKPEINSFILDDNNNNNNLDNDRSLKCMKYEIKRLKDSVNNLKDQANSLNNKYEKLVPSVKERDINLVPKDDQTNPIKHSMRCIKYEIKQIKEIVSDLQNKKNEEDVFNLKNQEIINDEIKDELNNLHSLISKLNEESKSSLGCLKYEMKRLKLLSKQNENDKETFTIEGENHKLFESDIADIQEDLEKNTDKINELNNVINNLKDEINKIKDNKKNSESEFILIDNENNENKSLKFEIKKLKEIVNNLSNDMNELKLNHEQQQKSPTERNLVILDEPSQNEESDKSLKCLKFEVKKLKEIINDLKDDVNRLKSNHEPQTKSFVLDEPSQNEERDKEIENMKSEINQLKESQSRMKSKINELRSNNINDQDSDKINSINHSLRCLKYEVKHLKESMDHSNRNIAKLKYLYKQLNSPKKEEVIIDNNDNGKLNQTIDSLKYEIRKLKENYRNINEKLENQNQIIPPLNTGLDEDKVNQTLKLLKIEVRKLKDNYNKLIEKQNENVNPIPKEVEIHPSEIFSGNEIDDLKQQISSSNKEFSHAINCMKYEIKKLKLNSNNKVQSQQTLNPNQNNDNQFSLEVDLNEISSDAEIIISPSVTVDEMQKSMRCMKYEIKKLKETMKNLTPNQDFSCSDIQKMISEENDRSLKPVLSDIRQIKDVINRLKSKINNNNYNSQEQRDDNEFDKSMIDDMNRSIQLLKLEIKKLKSKPNENDDVLHTINCIKYEVKKLKEIINERNDVIDRDVNIVNEQMQNNLYDWKSEIDELRQIINEANDEFKHTIKCIKFEMKRLKDKNNSNNYNNNNNKYNNNNNYEIPDDLLDRLAKCENNANEAKIRSEEAIEYASNAEEISQESKEITEAVRREVNKIKFEFPCVKYEVKKLKKQPTTPEHITVKPNDDDTEDTAAPKEFVIPEVILSQISEAEENAKEAKSESENAVEIAEAIKRENEQLKYELRCIKYEVEKLKERPTPAVTVEPTPRAVTPPHESDSEENSSPTPQEFTIPEEILTRLSRIESSCKEAKAESSKANETADESKLIAETIRHENEQLKYELGCIKYEVKRLKERTTPRAVTPPPHKSDSEEKSSPAPQEFTIPEEILTRLSRIEENCKEATQIASNAEKNLISHYSNEIKCIKYEIKKLKENQILSLDLDDLQTRLSDSEKNSNEAKSISLENKQQVSLLQQEREKDKLVLRCIKYEVKKLKDGNESASS